MAPEPRTRLKVRVRIAADAITAAVFGLGFATSVWAEPAPEAVYEAVLEVDPSTARRLSLARGFTLDHGPSSTQSPVLATRATLDGLIADGIRVSEVGVHGQPIFLLIVKAGYRMPDAGGKLLEDWGQSTDRGGHVVLGTSVNGQDIDALWLGQPPESGVATYRLLGGHHGDEWSSFEVVLAVAERLVNGDGVDPEITDLLDRSTIWLVPYVNPDGVLRANRYNQRGVDLNRNYGFEWRASEYRSGPSAFSEPETRAIRAFAGWSQPTVSLSLHSGAENYGYPWNWTEQPPADEDRYLQLAADYLFANTTPEFWSTQGAAWYTTFGDTNDWSYGRHGVFDTTIELSAIKQPPSADLQRIREEHVDALIGQFQPPTLRGRVRDAQTLQPLPAAIELRTAGVAQGRPFRTEPGTGVFHRIADHFDTVSIAAPGYRTQKLSPSNADDVLLVRERLDRRPILPVNATQGERWRLPDSWSGVLTVSQPGHASMEIWAWNGELQIEPGALASGAWTVSRSGGAVHARALLVSDGSGPAISVADQTATLALSAPPGTRAWALFGVARAPVPLAVLSEPYEDLRLDLSPVPNTGRVDLWILTAGRHQFVPDITDTAPATWVTDRPDSRETARGCACDVKTGHSLPWLWSYLLPLLVLSRRHRS